MRMSSRNPVLNGIEQNRTASYSYAVGETASFTGIATKSGFLLAIIIGISAMIWANFDQIGSGILMPLFFVSAIGGFICVMLAQFTRATAFFTILYAIFEGVFLGTFTFIVQARFDASLVFNAVTITFVIFGFLLFAYATGLFKVGDRFRKIVYTLMFTLIIFYSFYFIIGLFTSGMRIQNPAILIALTLGMIVLASFNLLIDFDNSKIAVDQGLPKKFEWNLSLGLLVSLIWLYIEVLRLLILLASRARD